MNHFNLRVYSYYNFFNSSISVDQYTKFSSEQNLSFSSLTSVDHVFGLIPFILEIERNKIQPVVGLTFSNFLIAEKKLEITVYPQNFAGLKNLFFLSSHVMMNSARSLDLTTLKKLHRNLFCVISLNSQTSFSFLQQAIKKLNFFETNLFLGCTKKGQDYQQYSQLLPIEQFLIFYPVRFLAQADKDFYNKISSMNKNLDEIQTENSIHFVWAKEIEKDFLHQKLTTNTAHFVSKINLQLRQNLKKLKNLNQKNDPEQMKQIKNFCVAQIAKKFANKEIYQKRFDYEFSIIQKKYLIKYFYIVWDYVKFAHQQEILVGPGRGSASGSLTAYLLGITQVDPLKYDLLFERFLNPEREELPDIDLDFEDLRREEIIKYIFDKYPKNNVALISTFQRLGIKMAFRDAGRILDIPLSIVNEICKVIPNRIISNQRTWLNSPRLKSFRVEYPVLFDLTDRLIGFPRQAATHSAGIIVSDFNLLELPGLSFDQGFPVVQLEMKTLSALNLVKKDILGLKKLTLISNLLSQINVHTNKNAYLSSLDLNKKEVYEILQKGETSGVFQLESEGMINLLKKIRPKNIEQIALVMSLYRPGPFRNIKLFFQENSEKITKIFPPFVEILKNTKGVPIYQEQILKMICVFSGINLGKSEILRKAISKQDFNLLNKFKKSFFSNSLVQKRTKDQIEKVWKILEVYANYGFNFSHALSYSIIAYIIAFFKVFHFNKFIVLLLNSAIGDKEKTQNYFFLASQKKMKLISPNVNKNLKTYTSESNKIFLPLILIKQVSSVWLSKIQAERTKNGNFQDVFDFVARMKIYGAFSNVFRQLVFAGALDGLGFTRATMLANEKRFFLIADLVRNNKNEIDWGLAKGKKKITTKKDNLTLNWQKMKEALEFRTDYQFIDDFVSGLKISSNKFFSLTKIIRDHPSSFVQTAFLVEDMKEITTKKGNKMAFCTASDGVAQLEIIVFPEVWMANSIKPGNIIYGEISLQKYQSKTTYILSKIKKIKLLTSSY